MLSRRVIALANKGVRSFSFTSSAMAKLRIGYVPEHFITPLAFAQQHYGLDADLQAEPIGTGALASRLKAHTDEKQLDVAIGLTEGFVADLGKTRAAGYEPGYSLIGNYVASPLLWSIVVGGKRQDLNSVDDLKGTKVGVSRVGSGSYIMSYVLADQKVWLDVESGKDPFEVVPVGDFAALRKAMNSRQGDFFMWEWFTTRKYWENGELKNVGSIPTPWPSWCIAARDSVKDQIPDMVKKINQGVAHFKQHPDQAVDYITSNMHYSKADAEEWMETVQFPDDVAGVSTNMVEDTIKILQKAGVLKSFVPGGANNMISVHRSS